MNLADVEVGSNDSVRSDISPTTKLAPKLSIERWQVAISSTNGNFRRLCAICVLLLTAIFCLCVVLFSSKEFSCNRNELCLTHDCVVAAADLLRSVDADIDPCDDFYDYACGQWSKYNTIQEDESRTDTFTIMRNELTDKLRIILETPASDNDCNATTKAKILYASCIDEEEIEKRAEKPLIKLLDEEFGGWPLLKNSSDKINETNLDWITLMGKLRQFNNEIIIGHNVGPHEYNASTYAIKLYPGTLGLSSADYYQNSSSRQYKSYVQLITRITQLLNAPNETIEKDINSLLEFEVKLANISRPYEKTGGAHFQRLPLKKLSKLIPKIDWRRYFKLAIPLTINDTETIGVYGLDYFLDIQELILSTPERTIMNYLLWRFVMNRANNLDSRFEKAQHEFFKEQYGTKSQTPRWKKCVDYVNSNLGIAVSALYVESHFNDESKLKAEEMIGNIKNIFFDILDEVEWMDSETRADAKVKAEVMEQHIGFPSYIKNKTFLNDEYSHLDFKKDKYFENVIGFLKNSTNKTQSKLYDEVDRNKWTVVPSVVNAHYHRYRNLMSFPAAVLQKPLFDKNYPNSLNYGAIGSVIGHELTHGFDSHGRHHDQYGNQRLWWHPNTIDRFIDKSECMIDQYGNYSIKIHGETVNVNGILTLSENIADNGGIKQSFKAYRKWLDRNGPEYSLPGLNMTHNQLFFLKYAQNWCQSMTPEGALNAIKTWKHTPGKFRVIGTLSNSYDFAQAFNCPKGSRMNPIEKCQVW